MKYITSFVFILLIPLFIKSADKQDVSPYAALAQEIKDRESFFKYCTSDEGEVIFQDQSIKEIYTLLKTPNVNDQSFNDKVQIVSKSLITSPIFKKIRILFQKIPIELTSNKFIFPQEVIKKRIEPIVKDTSSNSYFRLLPNELIAKIAIQCANDENIAAYYTDFLLHCIKEEEQKAYEQFMKENTLAQSSRSIWTIFQPL